MEKMSERLHFNHKKNRGKVSTSPSQRVEYHSMCKALNYPNKKLCLYKILLNINIQIDKNIAESDILTLSIFKKFAEFH